MSGNPPVPTHESYTERVARRLYADSFARNGLRMVILLFAVATLAPFLANSHAIVRVADGHLSFPIFPSMEPIEWRFLIYVPLMGLVIFLRHRWVKHPGRAVAVVLAVIALTEIALAETHPVNDPTTDRGPPCVVQDHASHSLLAD